MTIAYWCRSHFFVLGEEVGEGVDDIAAALRLLVVVRGCSLWISRRLLGVLLDNLDQSYLIVIVVLIDGGFSFESTIVRLSTMVINFSKFNRLQLGLLHFLLCIGSIVESTNRTDFVVIKLFGNVIVHILADSRVYLDASRPTSRR